MRKFYVFTMAEVKARDISGIQQFLALHYPTLKPDDAESLQLYVDFSDLVGEVPIFVLDDDLRRFSKKLHRGVGALCYLLETDSPFFRNVLTCRYKVSSAVERSGVPDAVIGFDTKQRMLVDIVESRKLARICEQAGCSVDRIDHLVAKFATYNPDGSPEFDLPG